MMQAGVCVLPRGGVHSYTSADIWERNGWGQQESSFATATLHEGSPDGQKRSDGGEKVRQPVGSMGQEHLVYYYMLG